MAETQEINQILGELQQEIQNLRDSEVVKFIKPFSEKTKELVNKIESINFPQRLDNIEKSIINCNDTISNLNSKLISFENDMQNNINSKFEVNNRKFKTQNILIFVLILIGVCNLVFRFIR